VSGRPRRAFVMGAGLGTRLRPLTETRPKPLVPIFGKPLITFALDHLAAAGIGSFVINTHHLADQFDRFFSGGGYRDVRLIHEPLLLETGGGIKNAQTLLGEEPFVVYSGDILTDIDIGRLIDGHLRDGNDVTLALRETGLASGVMLRDGRVTGLRGNGNCDFANVSVWNPSIFARIPAGEKISFVPVLTEWIAAGGRIGGVLLNENHWFNIGSRKEYLDVHRVIFEGGWWPAYAGDRPPHTNPGALVAPTARLEGFHSIGAGTEIGGGATIRDTVIWERAKIAPGTRLQNCIVRDGVVVSVPADNADL